MARKTLSVKIDQEGRDQGKVFFLTELDSDRAEKWAIRAFLAMAKSGIVIPDEIQNQGVIGIAQLGLDAISGVSYNYLEPLLDEMMSCVQCMPDHKTPNVVRALFPGDIEEIATRFFLRKQVMGLHVDFSKAVALLKSGTAPAETPAP